MWSINCALLRIIVPNRVIPSGFLSIFVINKNIDMALQTTGLEFSTWVWISPRMIKYCWWNKSWATLLVLHLLVRIYHKDVFAVGERIGVCFYSQIVRRMYGRLCTASSGCTVGTWIFSKAQYEKMEFLLRKVYRTITLRRYNNGSV